MILKACAVFNATGERGCECVYENGRECECECECERESGRESESGFGCKNEQKSWGLH